MSIYSFIAITFFLSLIIAFKQKNRGLSFWSSFFISVISIAGILVTILKILS